MSIEPASAKDMSELTRRIAAYNAERPGVIALRDNNRQQLLKKLMPYAALVVIAAVAAAFLAHWLVAVAIAVLGGGALIAAWLWQSVDADAPADALNERMRSEVLPAIFHDIDDFNFEANVYGFLDEIPGAIMPAYDKGEWGDLIEGSYRGRDFAINELHLIAEERSAANTSNTGAATRNVTRFKGVAIQARLARKVPETLILRKGRAAAARWIAKKLGAALKEPHVETGDSEFDRRHEVHCRDEKYARAVFSADGIKRFHAMQQQYSTGDFQFVARKRTLTMMIEQSHDFFEIPPIEHPFDEARDVPRLREEIEGFLALLAEMDRLLDVKAPE